MADDAASVCWTLSASEDGVPIRLWPQHEALMTGGHGDAIQSVLTVRFETLPDVERLRAAVSATFAAHAALRVFPSATHGTLVDEPMVSGAHPHSAVAVLRAADDQAVLTLQPPAGSVDGLGLRRLAHEVAARYRGQSRPMGLTDFSAVAEYLWELLAHQAGADFWRRSASALKQPPALLASFGVSTVAGSPRVANIGLPEATLHGLAAAAEANGVTLEAVFLAVWQAVVARLTTDPVVIGTYCAGLGDEAPDLIAATGRYVPFHTAPENTLRASVAVVAETLAETKAMAEYRPVDTDRYLFAYTCLTVDDELDFGAVCARAAYLLAPVALLEFQVGQQHGLPRPRLIYDTSVDEATVTWLVSAVREVAQNPDAVLADLACFKATELGSGGYVGGAPESAVAHLRRHAEERPDAVALTDGSRSLSFRDLWEAAGAVAARLRGAGVEPGQPVGVCVRRELPLLPAMLGVWRAGAYFIPLDPDHPSGRHEMILADAMPRVLLADMATARLFAESALRIVQVEAIPTGDSFDDAPLGDEQLAYVLYTSGSTGIPKGVEITHRALTNYLNWSAKAYTQDGGAGTLLHSSISVDLTITSIFVPLIAGQAIRLVPSDDPEELARVILDSRDLSFIKVTPSGLRILTRLINPAQMAAATRRLVLGGEQLYARDVAGLIDGAPGVSLINEYGPTETTVGSAAYQIKAGDVCGDIVPIGAPIQGTVIRIMADEGQPVPDGLIGEIYIGGDGLAVGYRNRPQENAARFVQSLGRRWYRTGDRGRLRGDGLLEFLGRSDDQVKVHGYRVEPTEVESVISIVPAIRDVAVVMAKRGDGGYLSAFLVLCAGAAEDTTLAKVKSVVSERLPAHCRPDRYEFLPDLPIAIGGKLDRGQLLERSARPAVTRPQQEPAGRSDHVRVLASLWTSLLGCVDALPEDSFFALGGDSITALHFVSAARKSGIILSVPDIVEHRTFAAIARCAQVGDGPVSAVPFEGPVPMSASQAAVLAGPDAEVDRWALRWRFILDDVIHDRLAWAVSSLARRHPAMRTRFLREGNRWMASVDVIDEFQPQIDVHTVSDGADVESAIAASESRMRVTEGGLIRLCVLDFGDHRSSVLVWVAHHLVSDVVSLQILAEELRAAYESGSAPAPDQGYVRWLKESAGRSGWRFTRPPNGVTTVSGQLIAALPHAARALRHADGERVRPLELVAAAALRALSLWHGSSRRICLTLEGHGRDSSAVDVTSSVGWLTSFRRLEVDVAATPTAWELLVAVRKELAPPANRTSAHLPSVALNYLGNIHRAGGSNPYLKEFDLGNHSTAHALFGLEMLGWLTGDTFTAACRWIGEQSVPRLLDLWDEAFSWLDQELAEATDWLDPRFDDVSAKDLARIMSQLDLS